MARPCQRMPQRRHDEAPRHAGIAKPHLGFGRVHVHVDARGRHVEAPGGGQEHGRIGLAAPFVDAGVGQLQVSGQIELLDHGVDQRRGR